MRRGEKSTSMVLWKPLEVRKVDSETGTVTKQQIPLLRSYNVFNVKQCEGLGLSSIGARADLGPNQKIAQAERIVNSMPNPPRIHQGGAEARYRPSEDRVQAPPARSFPIIDAFYATLFHELGHATGHLNRLCRPGISDEIVFRPTTYSREEMIAELTSAFCCAKSGLNNSLVENAASYIHAWLDILGYDPKAVLVAATHAQKAADYIQNVNPTA